MNHISIEGMDGVGKTTVCKLLAKKLGYKFVEKPLHYLLDKEDGIKEYQRIAKIVNSNTNRTFTAWYYGLNNIYLYEKFKNENIVTDRHIVSNYCWSGTEDNSDIYDLIINKIGLPKLTVILFADEETIVKRLKTRNKEDKDIERAKLSSWVYARMIKFCNEKEIPYVVINTINKTPEIIVDEILKEIKKLHDEN